MTISLIICTYNRPDRVSELLESVYGFSDQPDEIVVVDSSELTTNYTNRFSDLVLVKASHKNQPYQRFLGYNIAHSEVLLYLDDDMEIIRPDYLDIIRKSFSEDQNRAGLALHFENKELENSLSSVPKSDLFAANTILRKLKNIISGYPDLPPGKLGWCGNRGAQPQKGGTTEWLSGGAFAVRKDKVFINFNFQLLDIFERRIGMGEDAIIGYGISKQGLLWYEPELLFCHDDRRQSHYADDQTGFAFRVLYSRLYLSLEKNRIDGGGKLLPTIHYHWYCLFRLAGYFLNYLMNRTEVRKQVLAGSLNAWFKSIAFRLDEHKSLEYWTLEVENDIKINAANVDLKSR